MLGEIFIFIIGAVIGSFLNVCIVRMPQEKSVIKPRSHCVHCQHTIPWYDNVPLFSFLILRGRCRFCQAKISRRYVVVELLTAVTFLDFYLYFGFSELLVPYLIMFSCFIAATFIDFEHRIIPDEISVGGMLTGVLLSFVTPALHGFSAYTPGWSVHFQSLWCSVMGVLIGGGAIYAMGMLGDFLFKKESMGGGDIKLLAMIGAFLGWEKAILTFFVAPFFGAVYGVIEKIRTRDTTIAYGPFLVLGALISLFWGDALIDWVMKGYGMY